MKGFIKRLAGWILLVSTWWIFLIQLLSWISRDKPIAFIDKYMEWVLIDLMGDYDYEQRND